MFIENLWMSMLEQWFHVKDLLITHSVPNQFGWAISILGCFVNSDTNNQMFSKRLTVINTRKLSSKGILNSGKILYL